MLVFQCNPPTRLTPRRGMESSARLNKLSISKYSEDFMIISRGQLTDHLPFFSMHYVRSFYYFARSNYRPRDRKLRWYLSSHCDGTDLLQSRFRWKLWGWDYLDPHRHLMSPFQWMGFETMLSLKWEYIGIDNVDGWKKRSCMVSPNLHLVGETGWLG